MTDLARGGPGRAGRSLPAAALLLLSLALGCGGDDAAESAVEGASHVQRELLAAAWDTLWLRGGTEDDTLLLRPWSRLAVDREHVYVLDAAAYRVVAFRTGDGSLAWTAGRKGGGPNEFLSLTAVDVAASGGIVVADPDNGRLAILTPTGIIVRRIPLREISYVESLCALSDSSLLLSTLEEGQPLVRIAWDGTQLEAPIDLPWPDIAELLPLTRQAILASDRDKRECMMALSLGRGFARFAEGTFSEPYTYVEWFDLPSADVKRRRKGRTVTEIETLRERRIAALGVTLDDGVFAVAFEGLGEHRGRLIDLYEAGSGDYSGSLLFPVPIEAIARFGGVYFILHERDGYPALLAATPSAATNARR